MTTTAEQLEQWRGRHVVDADGDDVGKLDEVYYAGNGEPVLARVSYGLLGRHRALVPLTDSSVGRDYLRVAFRRDQIEQAGTEDVDQLIDPAAASRIGNAYGLALPGADRGYESAAAIAARRAEAAAAEERALALEAQAGRLGDDAESKGAHAAQADETATQAQRDAAAARDAAVAARSRADAAQADVP
jgi:hypothetical protein